jgi:7-carboxy-7-deazaguanine synthase
MKGINLGEKNGNYTNGITEKNRKIYEKRLLISNNCCELCKCPLLLHFHHLDGNHNNNKIENTRILCSSCHNTIHSRGYSFTKNEWIIKISEIFFSIQGEGATAGTPSLFIRTSGCTMNCPWCDTKEMNKIIKEYTYNEIINELLKFNNKYKIKNAVITGGEPLEQNIQPLIMILKLFGYRVEVESNGKPYDFTRNGFVLPLFVDCFNFSPKLWTKEKIRTFREDRIKKLVSVNSIFKFVVKDENDFKIVEKIISRGIPKERVWLMPLSTYNENDDKKIMQKVWKYCAKNLYKFSPRFQVSVWGKKDGI